MVRLACTAHHTAAAKDCRSDLETVAANLCAA